MNAIGSATQPVFINDKGVPSPCGPYPKGAAFLGTDANGVLIAKSAPTIPDQTPQPGDLINVNGRTVSVKHAIAAGYTGPIGIDANRQLVPYTATHTDRLSAMYTGDYTHYTPFQISYTKAQVIAGTWWNKIVDVNVNSIVNAHIVQNDVPPWGLIAIGNASGPINQVFHSVDSGIIESYEYWFTFLIPAGWSIWVALAQYTDFSASAPSSFTMSGTFVVSQMHSFFAS